MVDVSRVQKELTECNRDREVSGVSIALHDGASISHLTGTIAGPADSPYEGGTFVIDIHLPASKDAIHHQSMYLRDYPTFAATARYWTEAFAKSTSTGMEEKVQKLVEMGFPEDLVRSTLKSVDGDENMALEKLCSG
nr:unnamed protein product [Digitaria exilis]